MRLKREEMTFSHIFIFRLIKDTCYGTACISLCVACGRAQDDVIAKFLSVTVQHFNSLQIVYEAEHFSLPTAVIKIHA